tara:strand:- start:344 stop:496 length:153 start_codon:yes stop_codon:yes gene_type:complete
LCPSDSLTGDDADKSHTSLVNSASFSPDGTKVVTASSDYTAYFYLLHGVN